LAALPPEWDMDDMGRDSRRSNGSSGDLEKLAADLKGLSKGWGWKSVCRFALRSGITPRTIEAFRNGDWFKINSLSDDVIQMILRELRWMSCVPSTIREVELRLDDD
jgi:hypothetical protein